MGRCPLSFPWGKPGSIFSVGSQLPTRNALHRVALTPCRSFSTPSLALPVTPHPPPPATFLNARLCGRLALGHPELQHSLITRICPHDE